MYCTKCGKQISEDSIHCTFCGEKVFEQKTTNKNNKKNKPVYKKAWFWILTILILFFFLIIGSIGSQIEVSSDSNFVKEYQTNQELNNLQKQQEQEERERKAEEEKQKREQEEKEKKELEEKQAKENYINSCQKYTYNEIARNPNNFKNKPMTFTGEVIQVQEGILNSVILRINVTKGEYGFYEDTIYCTYNYSDNENKILEDDIVTIYGDCKGSTSYTSILGQSITLPKLEIKYLEITNL